jgi:hypothetical protein
MDALGYTGYILALIALFAGVTIFLSCSASEDAASRAEEIEARQKSIMEDMVVVTPRPGVECYVFHGYGSASPRIISCVAVAQ